MSWVIDGNISRLVDWLVVSRVIDGNISRLVDWLVVSRVIDGNISRLVDWLVVSRVDELGWLGVVRVGASSKQVGQDQSDRRELMTDLTQI